MRDAVRTLAQQRYRETFGRYYEEFAIGDVYEHRPGRTISETDNTWFSLLTMNTHPLHFDFDVALHQLSYPATWYLNEGDVPARMARSAHLSAVPVQTFETADGWLFIMCMTDKFFNALVGAMNRADLASDERFSTMKARRANRGLLTQELDAEFAKAGTQEWLSRLNGLLPVAPVFDIPQAFANPFVERIGMVTQVPHPQRPDLRCLASPLRINGERPQATACSPLGADTESVLRGIGFGADEIAALRAGAAA